MSEQVVPVSLLRALEMRINEQQYRAADYEQRITHLESQVRSLFALMEEFEARLDFALRSHAQRINALEDEGDEGVVTLRITAERGRS